MNFDVELLVMPRSGTRDPQAEAVEGVLRKSGFAGVRARGVGRVLQLSVEAETMDAAREQIVKMCSRLLVNPNLETFRIDFLVAKEPG